MKKMDLAGNSQSLAAYVRQWARDSLRSRGVLGSGRYLAEQAWLLFRDSLPDRRRSRFGDVDYDCDFGVDTTWARLPWSVRLREVFVERLYQPTVPEEFGVIMQHLARVDFSGFTFIDMGSGKGRALLLAAEYPFLDVVGVEVQRKLHEIAEGNIERFCEHPVQCRDLRSVCMDARQFEFPPTPLIVYLFNPFPDYALRTVLDNLEASLKRDPRPAYVIYNAPFEQLELTGRTFVRKMVDHPQFVIYTNAGPA